jgi:hypothetical protein
MADQTPRRGRLIAVDGTRGNDVAGEATRLADRLRSRGVDCAISRWDASGVFAQLLPADDDDLVLSPRMLTLLYATDLVFRLRWQIQPALAEGRVVIAAPYVHTAVAVGVGFGLTETWVREVLRVAPEPEALRLAKERKAGRGWRPKPGRGYGEFSTAVLDGQPRTLPRRAMRDRAMQWLETVEETGAASARRAIVRRFSS